MKALSTRWLLALALLAGCTSNAEKQAAYEIAEFYGGDVHLTSGRNFTTAKSDPRGHYLAIAVSNPALGRFYDNLQLPASGCAYLAFSNLTPSQQQSYDYVKVTLQDSSSEHRYTFTSQQLQQVLQAATSLRTLIFNIQNSDYLAAANDFNPDALGTMPRDSLPNLMNKVGNRLNPFTEYRVHGFQLTELPVAGKPLPLMQLFVSVPRPPEPDRFLVVTINPAMSDTEHFLYGIKILN